MAQGGGDHTISAVVADAEATVAIGALHEAFALRRLRAHVRRRGDGRARVGACCRCWLPQSDALRADGLHLVLAGVADSRRLLWDPSGLNAASAVGDLADAPPTDLDALTERLTSARLERLVVVDATPSAAVADRHPAWLAAGVAVVTPNKQATGRRADWRAAQAAARAAKRDALPVRVGGGRRAGRRESAARPRPHRRRRRVGRAACSRARCRS